jgi:enamine deaminase RidA (YjgF/YER057c/UK114 family)
MSNVEHLTPEGLLHNAGFSQVVVAAGKRPIYTAGRVAIDERGELVGSSDLAAQTEQAMRNVGLALAAARAGYADIVKITTYVVNYKPSNEPSLAKHGHRSWRVKGRQQALLLVSRRWRYPSGSWRSRLLRLLTERVCAASESLGQDAAIHSHRVTNHEACGRGAQPHDRTGDFFRLA